MHPRIRKTRLMAGYLTQAADQTQHAEAAKTLLARPLQIEEAQARPPNLRAGHRIRRVGVRSVGQIGNPTSGRIAAPF
ncbi:MAG: hypothetical protein JO336_00160 [Acidobacteriia bacterium]|nr:hypothetical protein [Terriglobia bacterium]